MDDPGEHAALTRQSLKKGACYLYLDDFAATLEAENQA
jgi:hypothetical protein